MLSQQGLLCFGPRDGKQQTFALLDEWLPSARTLDRGEALGELARRYFESHGPATVQDFAWWAGLTVTDARTGLESAQAGARERRGGRPPFLVRRLAVPRGKSNSAYLLPPWDEFTVAYRDRSDILDPKYARRVNSGGGVLSPVDRRAGRGGGHMEADDPEGRGDGGPTFVQGVEWGRSRVGRCRRRADVRPFLGVPATVCWRNDAPLTSEIRSHICRMSKCRLANCGHPNRTPVAQTTLDLLQGTLDLLVLKTLSWGPAHGYAIARWTQQLTGDAFKLGQGSLYPALYRLEERGWIESEWRLSDTNRRTKVYRLTPVGRAQLKAETAAWTQFVEAMGKILRPRHSRRNRVSSSSGWRRLLRLPRGDIRRAVEDEIDAHSSRSSPPISSRRACLPRTRVRRRSVSSVRWARSAMNASRSNAVDVVA